MKSAVLVLISLHVFARFVLVYTQDEVDIPLEEITAVEGGSINVNILCTLDKEEPEPIYWLINGNLYDSYNFPKIFMSVNYGTLTLPSVNRRMNDWNIQCVRVTSNKELRHGENVLLKVLYDADEPDPGTSSSLEPSNLGRITIDYQNTCFGVNETTISWLYYPVHDSPCAESHYYELDLYSITGSGDLQLIDGLDSIEESIVINSSNLISTNNEMIYFKVSVLSQNNDSRSCGTTEYLQEIFSGKENHAVIYANGNSSSFEIPSEFINSSIQLIWSTDGVTQCVCPLVEELIQKCACNGNNTLSLSSNTITISRSEDVHSLVIYLANSTLTSCCNVRSIIVIYRVLFDQGFPDPILTQNNSAFCFSSSMLDYPVTYEVNLTDSIGSLLSRYYNSAQCLSIDNPVCGPFQLSVSITTSTGKSADVQETLLPNDENDPCQCYETKDQIEATANGTKFTLNCSSLEYGGHHFAIFQTETNVLIQDNISCTSQTVIDSLRPSTNYDVRINNCSLISFEFSDGSMQLDVVVLVIVIVIVTVVVVPCLIIVTIVIVALYRRSRSRSRRQQIAIV